jgi:hypothetical protein
VAAAFTCRGVTVRMADGVLSGIVSILVSMPIHTFWEGQHHDFESWIDWIHRITKKKTHDSIGIYRRRLCQVYSVSAKQPMDCLTTEQVQRVRRVPFRPTIDDTLKADSCSLVP